MNNKFPLLTILVTSKSIGSGLQISKITSQISSTTHKYSKIKQHLI